MRRLPKTMTKKVSQKTFSTNHQDDSQETSFDCRGLDEPVIARLNKNTDREAQMIADFNAKVNLLESKKSNKHKKVEENVETDGPKGLEPTRYGDWERKGRCYDF